MDKRIITWKWGNNSTHDEFTTSRAFIIDNYGDNFAHYSRMVGEAKKDFPDLKDEDISVGRITNSTYMKEFCVISFLVEENLRKAGWDNWNRFDFDWE